MRDYAKALGPETVRKMLAGTCVIVHGQAVLDAPVLTGHLRNSISWKLSSTNGGLNSQPGEKANESETVSAPGDSNTAHIGTNLEYAAAVEYGRPDMPNYPMQPYMRIAVYQTKDKVHQFNAGVLSQALQEAVK
jgi:hypothetical protein